MNYTDEQLKVALAKMLPELIFESGDLFIYDAEFETNSEFGSGSYRQVLDTELLHLCRLIRKNFTPQQRVNYLNTMRELIGHKVVSDYDIADADWDKQTIALAKVKGIDKGQ
jgi:hypothetical protein